MSSIKQPAARPRTTPRGGDKPIRVRVRDQQNSEASQTATVQIVAQNLTLSAANNGPVRRDQEVLGDGDG
jgi:hypothetical protein